MHEPDLRIETKPREYENMTHVDFGLTEVKAAPLIDPKGHLASLAKQVIEVIAGIRGIDQLSTLLNEHVYESLKLRASKRAELRLLSGKRAVIKPTEVVNVRYQYPADGVIESVVVLSNRDRARAVAIRLEAFHGNWRATNIGFL